MSVFLLDLQPRSEPVPSFSEVQVGQRMVQFMQVDADSANSLELYVPIGQGAHSQIVGSEEFLKCPLPHSE